MGAEVSQRIRWPGSRPERLTLHLPHAEDAITYPSNTHQVEDAMLVLKIAAVAFLSWMGLQLLRAMVAIMSATLKEMGTSDTLKSEQKLRLWWWMIFRKRRIRVFEAAVNEGRTARAAYHKALEA